MNKKMFSTNEYMEIHQLAYEYQAGNKNAGEELLNRFSAFKLQYLTLFGNHECNIVHTTSARNFLKLFIDNKVDRQILNAYMFLVDGKNASVCRKITKVVDTTIKKVSTIFSQLDNDDIEQNLNLILLEMFKKYKDTKPSLHHYINQVFHYYLYRHLDLQARDPVARGNTIYKKQNEDDSSIDVIDRIWDRKIETTEEETINYLEIDLVNKINCIKENDKRTSIYEDEFLNEKWIDGITCSDMFKTLTKMERYILVKWYIENQTDSAIAEEFGLCRITVNKRRNLAKEKLLIEGIKRKYIKE